jgi:hypothetical protein
MTKKSKGMLIAGAAAALFLSGAVTARAEEKTGEKVSCAGINACKGQGSCSGAGNSCAGQNGCKGKGVVKATAAECKEKGGKVVEGGHK